MPYVPLSFVSEHLTCLCGCLWRWHRWGTIRSLCRIYYAYITGQWILAALFMIMEKVLLLCCPNRICHVTPITLRHGGLMDFRNVNSGIVASIRWPCLFVLITVLHFTTMPVLTGFTKVVSPKWFHLCGFTHSQRLGHIKGRDISTSVSNYVNSLTLQSPYPRFDCHRAYTQRLRSKLCRQQNIDLVANSAKISLPTSFGARAIFNVCLLKHAVWGVELSS